jgi:hypothetical protein
MRDITELFENVVLVLYNIRNQRLQNFGHENTPFSSTYIIGGSYLNHQYTLIVFTAFEKSSIIYVERLVYMAIEVYPGILLYSDTNSFALEVTYPRSMVSKGRKNDKNGNPITKGSTRITWHPSIGSALREAFDCAIIISKDMRHDEDDVRFSNMKKLYKIIKEVTAKLLTTGNKIRLIDLNPPKKLEKKIKQVEDEIDED